jgi:hypothetical protein
MEKYIVNRPLKSKWIGGMYVSILVFVAFLYLTLYAYDAMYETSFSVTIFFSAVMAFVLLLILAVTISFYRTRYTIKDGFLYSWSPFMVIKVNIKDIKKVERTMVPMHFRVGASLYSGYFYVPNLGWVGSIITNLRDAILITTKKGKYYMITPSNPERFMKLLK